MKGVAEPDTLDRVLPVSVERSSGPPLAADGYHAARCLNRETHSKKLHTQPRHAAIHSPPTNAPRNTRGTHSRRTSKHTQTQIHWLAIQDSLAQKTRGQDVVLSDPAAPATTGVTNHPTTLPPPGPERLAPHSPLSNHRPFSSHHELVHGRVGCWRGWLRNHGHSTRVVRCAVPCPV